MRAHLSLDSRPNGPVAARSSQNWQGLRAGLADPLPRSPSAIHCEHWPRVAGGSLDYQHANQLCSPRIYAKQLVCQDAGNHRKVSDEPPAPNQWLQRELLGASSVYLTRVRYLCHVSRQVPAPQRMGNQVAPATYITAAAETSAMRSEQSHQRSHRSRSATR